MVRRVLVALMLAAGLLGLTGCPVPPRSTEPLTDPEESPVDKDLLGVWAVHASAVERLMGKEADDSSDMMVYLHVNETHAGRATLCFVFHGLDETDRGLQVDTFEGVCSRSGDDRFLSLNRTDINDASGKWGDQYMVVRYEVTADGCLAFHLMEHDPVQQAIKDGRLKGDLGEAGRGRPAIVRDAREAWAKFVEETPKEKLFQRVLCLVKQPEPVKQLPDSFKRWMAEQDAKAKQEEEAKKKRIAEGPDD